MSYADIAVAPVNVPGTGTRRLTCVHAQLRRLGAKVTADFRVRPGWGVALGIEVVGSKAPDAPGDPVPA